MTNQDIIQQQKPSPFKIPFGDFITRGTFSEFGSCIGIIWFVSSVLSGLTGLNLKITGFVVAILVAYVRAYLLGKKVKGKYVIAFFNGVLMYGSVLAVTSFTPYLNDKTAATAMVQISKPSIRDSIISNLSNPWMPDRNLVSTGNELLEYKRKADEALEMATNTMVSIQNMIPERVTFAESSVDGKKLTKDLQKIEEGIAKIKELLESATPTMPISVTSETLAMNKKKMTEEISNTAKSIEAMKKALELVTPRTSELASATSETLAMNKKKMIEEISNTEKSVEAIKKALKPVTPKTPGLTFETSGASPMNRDELTKDFQMAEESIAELRSTTSKMPVSATSEISPVNREELTKDFQMAEESIAELQSTTSTMPISVTSETLDKEKLAEGLQMTEESVAKIKGTLKSAATPETLSMDKAIESLNKGIQEIEKTRNELSIHTEDLKRLGVVK